MSYSKKPIFALDIGTRSIVGILLEKDENDQYHVVAMELEEHQERSMLDGQIHDVVAVAQVISRVKERLEKNHGPLTTVAVAAAGRSLRTIRVKTDLAIKGYPPLGREEILALEFSAVQEAQRELAMVELEQDSTQYYCVGYSVVNYYLDHSIIGNLIDQRGDLATVEIIATFLPRIVVDNILASLKRADLNMSALTLEPIAAIHVLIPSTMRRLNIALVDIGAGTSDIAITEGGSITAYGMVPVAGDEITDALMQAYILDFPIAEQVKRELNEMEQIQFTDILGFESLLSSKEIVHQISADIQKLSQSIGERILELNGKAPQAVLLIGGGSLTPRLAPTLAAYLGVPDSRVAVRGVDAIQRLTIHDERIKGPEFITPIGIGVSASEHPVKHLTVHVNDKTLRLFDLRAITVGEALLASGIEIKKLHGLPGLALTVKVNNRIKIFPGSHGTSPQIKINHVEGFLDTIISDGDVIQVFPGTDGENGQASVKDVMDEITTLDLYVNGEPFSFPPIVEVNGRPATWDTPLQERDEVTISMHKKISDIIPDLYQTLSLKETFHKSIKYYLNGEPREVKLIETEILLNHEKASLQSSIQNGDRIEIQQFQHKPPMISELFAPEDIRGITIKVTFNQQEIQIPTTTVTLKVNGVEASLDQIIQDGDQIMLEQQSLPTPVFSDIFRYTDFQVPTYVAGYTVLVLKNGLPSRFDEPIADGDQFMIRNSKVQIE